MTAKATAPEDPAPAGVGARVRHARVYLLRVRPIVIVLGVLAATLDLFFGPRAVALAELEAVGVQAAAQLVAIPLVLRGVDALRVVRASILVDAVAITLLVAAVPQPELVSHCYVILVPLLGYFASPRLTLAGSALMALGLSTIAPRLEQWGDPTVVPWSAFLVVATGITMAFITSRMLVTERMLEERVATEARARHRLEEIDASRDRLIANVSHELRTPLTSTIGAIETLLREDLQLDAAQHDRLMRLARDGGLRLLALVEDLLTLGATRPDSLELSTSPERLGDLVRDAVEGIDPGERTITVTIDGDPLVRVDRMRMLQVVSNLVVNALRHGRGDVVVEIAAGDDVASMRVLDDGPGVDPAHVRELFLPFARFSTRTDSTGLGLAICRTIVEAHGGSIEYHREDGRTCFAVRLSRT